MRPKGKTSEARTVSCRYRRQRIPTGFSRSLSTLTLIDNGWREVADTALAFVRKHGPKAAAA